MAAVMERFVDHRVRPTEAHTNETMEEMVRLFRLVLFLKSRFNVQRRAEQDLMMTDLPILGHNPPWSKSNPLHLVVPRFDM